MATSSSVNFASVGNLGGAQVSDWAAYTPTFTGFGTAASVDFMWRRVGDSMEIMGIWTTGTCTATEARISLPSGYLPDASKTASLKVVGDWYFGSTSSSAPFAGSANIVTPNAYLTFGYRDGSTNAFSQALGSTAFGNAVKYGLLVVVPISGWTSSTPNGSLVSAYSGTQVGAGGGWTNNTNTAYVDFSAATTSNTLTQIVSQNITAIAEATKMPAITCTLPSTGIYLVTASGSGSSNGSNAAFFRLVDGSGTIINGGQEANLATTQFGPFTLTGIYNATGTTVTFKLQGAATAGNANIAQDTQRPITWSVVKLN
jgi:hypothetical protein